MLCEYILIGKIYKIFAMLLYKKYVKHFCELRGDGFELEVLQFFKESIDMF